MATSVIWRKVSSLSFVPTMRVAILFPLAGYDQAADFDIFFPATGVPPWCSPG